MKKLGFALCFLMVLSVMTTLLLQVSRAPAQNKVVKDDAIKEQARRHLMAVMHGGLNPNHIGTEAYEKVKAHLIKHGKVYNSLIADEYVNPILDVRRLSTLTIGPVEYTAQSDPKGSLAIAETYHKKINNSLFVYDLLPDQKLLSDLMPEEDIWVVNGTIEQRRSVAFLITELKGLASMVKPPTPGSTPAFTPIVPSLEIVTEYSPTDIAQMNKEEIDFRLFVYDLVKDKDKLFEMVSEKDAAIIRQLVERRAALAPQSTGAKKEVVQEK